MSQAITIKMRICIVLEEYYEKIKIIGFKLLLQAVNDTYIKEINIIMGATKDNHKKQSLVLLLLYVLVLFLVWTIYEMFLRNKLHNESTLLTIIIRNSIKIMVRTVPVLMLLKYYYKESVISYLKFQDGIKMACY